MILKRIYRSSTYNNSNLHSQNNQNWILLYHIRILYGKRFKYWFLQHFEDFEFFSFSQWILKFSRPKVIGKWFKDATFLISLSKMNFIFFIISTCLFGLTVRAFALYVEGRGFESLHGNYLFLLFGLTGAVVICYTLRYCYLLHAKVRCGGY